MTTPNQPPTPIDAAESGLMLRIQLAEADVVKEARAMRRGGVGMGRLFDAVDAVERLYDQREQAERRRAVTERMKRELPAERRVV